MYYWTCIYFCITNSFIKSSGDSRMIIITSSDDYLRFCIATLLSIDIAGIGGIIAYLWINKRSFVE
jgi:hypothetical protein